MVTSSLSPPWQSLSLGTQACTAALAGMALLLHASTASAAPSESDRAAAQALFEQARQLVDDGKYEAACPKFAESQRLDPAPGTQFNLADCYEKTGRLASAWSLFLEVAVSSKAAGRPEHEALARKRAAALKPKLPRLTIEVPAESRVPELSVGRCSVSVGEAQWGAAMPVDSGRCLITAKAPGHKPWQRWMMSP